MAPVSRRGFIGSALAAAAAEKASPYAIANIGGTAAESTGGEFSGVFLPARVLTLKSGDAASVLQLRWPGLKPKSLGMTPCLRLALASELRTFQRFEVSVPKGAVLGMIDLSLGSVFQILNLPVPRERFEEVSKSGLDVRLLGPGSAVSVFAPSSQVPPQFQPSMLGATRSSPRNEFLDRMASRSSLTPYGWQEGCVLDGLAALAAKAPDGSRYDRALEDHLRLLFPPGMTPRKIGSIEGTSCIAQLTAKDPKHPEVAATLAFWRSKVDSNGAILDGQQTAAEGNYTVAWPLAVLARELKRPDLAAMAIQDLRQRRERLVDSDGSIWLRHRKDAVPQRTYRLWSRGTAWYLLGLAKTLDALPSQPEDLIAELRRASAYLLPMQREDGMWNVFLAETGTAPETSGTAGIAAAFAMGARRGWLGQAERQSARRALAALDQRLTPDGFLTGVAPANRWEGGEKFQRATKGEILQWGMGMMAQLAAELDPPSK